MQQTNQYKLNLIESGDTFSAEPLNENMEKVEEVLTEHESLLAGQLKCAVGTYTGNGLSGEANKTTITVEFKPFFVMVWAPEDSSRIVGIQGQNVKRYYGESHSTVGTVWGENSVGYYSSGVQAQMNVKNDMYHYIVLGV